MKQVVISLSGGMDSSTLLLRLIREGYNIQAISVDYNQKHRIELEKATELVNYINKINFKNSGYRLESWGEWYKEKGVKHQVIKLDGLSQLLNSSLVDGGLEVPEGHYEKENMKATVVPNRNKIFSSIIQSIALSMAEKNKAECVIAMGIHAGDHQIYRDCRQEFRDVDYQAFLEGNENGHLVKYYTPYLFGNKFTILEDGVKCCELLGLDFDEVYKRTNTSYKPYPSGNSDYKSAASVERVEAFIKLGRPDPVQYEDENGVASWDTVVKHVKGILAAHGK